MAPRKPKAPTKPVNKDRVGDDARVAKRPLRGYRRSRDGTLNVLPMSKEENDTFTANQTNSPLLRLPAEIRDMIWRYALEGKTFVATCRMNPYTRHITKARFKRSRTDPRHGTALLRTCRQTFLETASYPITLGSLSCDDPSVLIAAAKKLRAHQQKQVSRIRMSLTMLDGNKFRAIESEWCPQMIRGILPAAKDFALRIRRWINEADDDVNNEDYFDSLRENLNKVWRKQGSSKVYESLALIW